MKTNGGTQNEIKIEAMRTNENENDSCQKKHPVIKNFRLHQKLHGPFTIAWCGHSADFGHIFGVVTCLCVRLSVRPSHASIVSKRLNLS